MMMSLHPPTVHFFFKVLMDGFQDKLAIPRKFASKFESKLPETVVLECPQGKSTNIGLTRTEHDVYFGHGWTQFASDHSLEKFDLLVFRFDEKDTCFQVMLFDKTACEKEGVHVACVRESDRPGLDANGTQSVQINKECTSDALSSESSPHRRESSFHSIDSYYVPSSESSEDGSDSSSVKGQKRENTFRARHGYPSTSCVKKNPRQNSPMKKNRNGANDNSLNSLKDSNKVPISHNKDRVRRAETSSKGESALNPTNLGTSRKLTYYRYFRSKRRAVTIEEQQLAGEKAKERAVSSESSLHSIDSYYVPSSESSEDGSDSSSVKGQNRENTFRARHGYPSTSCVKKNPQQNSPMKKNRNGANNNSPKDSNKVPIYCNKDRVPQAETCSKGKSGLNPIHLGTSTRKLSYYSYFRSNRRPVTIEEQQITLEKAQERAVSSTKPYFIKVMKLSHVNRRFFMTIPLKFLRQNFSQVPEIGLLRVTGKAKTWNVTITAKGHNIQPGIGISGGWADFVMKNNLEKGDACLFELDNINPICKSIMKFDVTIFRVVNKIVPLKRTQGN